MKSQDFYKLHDKIQKMQSQGLINLTPKQREWYRDNIEYYNFLRLFPQNQELIKNRPTTVTKTSQSATSTVVSQEKKLELVRKIKQAEKVIGQAERWFADHPAPDRSAGNWSNLDYEDNLANLRAYKKKLEQWKAQLAKYETQ